MKIRVLHWSHGSNEWMFYSFFNSEDEMNSHIESKGFDQRFFKVER